MKEIEGQRRWEKYPRKCRKVGWSGMGIHAFRREEEYVGKIVMVMEVPGKRTRGRPKRRWLDKIKNDLSERELSVEGRCTSLLKIYSPIWMMVMEVPGKRTRGRPKRRWLDKIKNDLSERELSVEGRCTSLLKIYSPIWIVKKYRFPLANTKWLEQRSLCIAKSSNTILQSILNSDALYTSQMYQHWRSVLYIYHFWFKHLLLLWKVCYHWMNVLYNVFESNVYYYFIWMQYSGIKTMNWITLTSFARVGTKRLEQRSLL